MSTLQTSLKTRRFNKKTEKMKTTSKSSTEPKAVVTHNNDKPKIAKSLPKTKAHTSYRFATAGAVAGVMIGILGGPVAAGVSGVLGGLIGNKIDLDTKECK